MERIDRRTLNLVPQTAAWQPGQVMRSKVRAYSHQGHGPRADHQAGYLSATSDSTTSLAKGSRSIHVGHLHPYAASSATGCRAPEAAVGQLSQTGCSLPAQSKPARASPRIVSEAKLTYRPRLSYSRISAYKAKGWPILRRPHYSAKRKGVVRPAQRYSAR